MSARRRARSSKPKLELQPGAVLTDEQDGSRKGHATWIGDRDNFAERIKQGGEHPFDKNSHCFAVQTTYLKLRKIQIDADFIGLSQNPTAYFLEFCGSVGEEPIETHPHFVDIIGGTPAAPLHQAQFDADTKEFLGFPCNAPNHLGGVRSYFRPSVIVRVSYWMLELPNPAALGTVVDPSEIPGLVLPPNCHDLLITNFSYRQIIPKAPPYQVTIEMLASGPNGWNDLIYVFNP